MDKIYIALARSVVEKMSRDGVLLLGASGQIGVFAIPRLLSAGFDVIAVSRNPRPRWFPEFERVRWVRLEALHSGATANAQMLISAGPITLATQLIDQCPHLKRAVIFSTSSVFSKLESHDRKEKRHMQQILMDEAVLSNSCESHGIPLSLYRPTLIYGCGMDGNVSWLAKWIRKFGFIPIAGDAAGLRQPVHADDLAQAAVATLLSDSPLALDVPLCGGSTLSFREMVEAIFMGLGKPVRIISVPRRMFTALAYVCRLVPKLRSIRPEMIRRESVDLVFDDTTAREILNYQPRVFAPGLAEFSRPDADYLKQLASL
ncbi:MAG: nucleoside-diphosphate-sugar epimerase [Lysobacterales bacterium]|jgi:nucleoside-diphosphate-sugar epimerase